MGQNRTVGLYELAGTQTHVRRVIRVEVFPNPVVVSYQHIQARETRKSAGKNSVDSDHCPHAGFPSLISSQPWILETPGRGKKWSSHL